MNTEEQIKKNTIVSSCSHNSAIFHYFSLMDKLHLELCIAYLCNLLCLSCLSGWKTVSVHVFGMKHLWDIHLLLLILLYLLGAATSQVNPGLCCHLRANCIPHPSVLGFKCLQTQTAVRSCLRVCESHKMTLSFGQCSLARAPVQTATGSDVGQVLLCGSHVVPSLWFGLFDPSMHVFLQLSLHCMGGLCEREPFFFFTRN